MGKLSTLEAKKSAGKPESHRRVFFLDHSQRSARRAFPVFRVFFGRFVTDALELFDAEVLRFWLLLMASGASTESDLRDNSRGATS